MLGLLRWVGTDGLHGHAFIALSVRTPTMSIVTPTLATASLVHLGVPAAPIHQGISHATRLVHRHATVGGPALAVLHHLHHHLASLLHDHAALGAPRLGGLGRPLLQGAALAVQEHSDLRAPSVAVAWCVHAGRVVLRRVLLQDAVHLHHLAAAHAALLRVHRHPAATGGVRVGGRVVHHRRHPVEAAHVLAIEGPVHAHRELAAIAIRRREHISSGASEAHGVQAVEHRGIHGRGVQKGRGRVRHEVQGRREVRLAGAIPLAVAMVL
mmetsp:Transcript_47494/g.136135  ORF Transcript_47494/g.136135 Transcript_47494/m.136135 type:complete len:268 (-) Transcript_47494:263-1066(-)